MFKTLVTNVLGQKMIQNITFGRKWSSEKKFKNYNIIKTKAQAWMIKEFLRKSEKTHRLWMIYMPNLCMP